MDWGLAKVVGRPDLAAQAGDLAAVVTDHSPITCSTTSRMRDGVSKSIITTRCQVPSVMHLSTNGTTSDGPSVDARTCA